MGINKQLTALFTKLFICLCACVFSAVSPASADSGEFKKSKNFESRGPKKGILLIVGGGRKNKKKGPTIFKKTIDQVFIELAIEASSNKTPKIVVIATAQGKKLNKDTVKKHKKLKTFSKLIGQKNTSIVGLHTLSRKRANAKEFVSVIDAADAVWLTGGKQYHLAKTFLGTETEKALWRLLNRGGVIGGSSAGAQVQSSFMTRGALGNSKILGNGKTQRGFAFISNSAFDVHVSARKRNKDLFKLFSAKPEQFADKKFDPGNLLGIGIDEGTAIIVRKDRFEVIGHNQVFVFDPKKWEKDIEPFYDTLSSGDSYDIRKRMRLMTIRKE